MLPEATDLILGGVKQGTGVTIASGVLSIGQSVGSTDDVTFNNVTSTQFNGNVNGSVSSISNHINRTNSLNSSSAIGQPTYSSSAAISSGIREIQSGNSAATFNAGINLNSSSVVLVTPISPFYNGTNNLQLVVTSTDTVNDTFTVKCYNTSFETTLSVTASFYFMIIE